MKRWKIIKYVSQSSPFISSAEHLNKNQIYYGELMQEGDIGLLYHSHSLLTAHPYTTSPLSSAFALLPHQVLTVKRLLSPLAPSEIKTIRGLGAQYPTLPATAFVPAPLPILFYKPTSTLGGPEDSIRIPELARGMNNDYEVEICVVLGKTIRNVSPEKALDAVLGYCSSNDVSSRGLCAKGGQWGLGKSFDCQLLFLQPFPIVSVHEVVPMFRPSPLFFSSVRFYSPRGTPELTDE